MHFEVLLRKWKGKPQMEWILALRKDKGTLSGIFLKSTHTLVRRQYFFNEKNTWVDTLQMKI